MTVETTFENKSSFTLRHASLVVLVLAIIVSGYLSYLKAANAHAVCIEGSVFDCATVLNSFYSEIRGIPIPWLGLAANLLMTSLLLLETGVGFFKRYSVVLVFGISLFTLLYSIYLVYVQAVLIKAYCPWCLLHEVFMAILFALSVWRMVNWDSQAE